MKVHNLKIKPQYFKDVVSGDKTFEVRKNDRDFEVGDIITLREFENDMHTGNFINVEIVYILNDEEYCKPGYVVLGFRLRLELGGTLAMTSQEMFEELGFITLKNETAIEYVLFIDELEVVFIIGFDLRTKTSYATFADEPVNIDVPLLKNPLMKLVEQQKKELGWLNE